MARTLPNFSQANQLSPKLFRDIRERVIEFLLLIAAVSSVATTAGIIVTLLFQTIQFFRNVALHNIAIAQSIPVEDLENTTVSVSQFISAILSFLTGTNWAPGFEPPQVGVLPLVCGTLVTTLVSLVVAIPLGTIAAIYLSEFAPAKVREIVKPVLELLAGVPTVVYGYFALLFVTPILQYIFPEIEAANMLSAGLVMGVMIIPYISSLSEDAMQAVPNYLREGSYATGATPLQTAMRVIVPSAISGISAAYVLGISRAIGETMIVAIAAGGQPNLTLNPLERGQTMTAYIVEVSKGDIQYGTLDYETIFAVGLTLFFLTLIFNILGHWLIKRYREIY
ncbi:phosphate ABC transporter, inner membrane subunit PstC [Calothrix sp. NIES-4101]|nr:phosphate ABC transporter, inner membrane subunit PstC [Calothrix sp. NIES-4101]